MAKNLKKHLFVFLTVSFIFAACSPVRYVKEGQYVVNEVKIVCDEDNIKTSRLNNVVQPQPLNKIFGIYAFRARIYNIPNPKKDGKRELKKQEKLKKINAKRDKKFDNETEKILREKNVYFNKAQRLLSEGDTIGYIKAKNEEDKLNELWSYRRNHSSEMKEENRKINVFTWYEFIRKIGQKPELYDTVLVNFTLRQIDLFMKNQGYFKSDVYYEINPKPKRVDITYVINAGKPLKISSVVYNFPDSTTQMTDFFNKLDYKFKAGSNFDVEALENYRTNLTNKFRDNGFYYFSKQLISFKIDTIGRYQNAILYVNFNNNIDKKVYEQWHINKIYIHNDFYPNQAFQNPELYNKTLDTNYIYKDFTNKYYVIKKYETVVKPKFILNEIYIYQDSLYRLNDTKITYSHLSKFKIYKLTNIQFEENKSDTSQNLLNCNIQLTPAEKISVSSDIESTNTSATIGAAGNVMFSHRNLSKGGEILDLKFQIALEKQKTSDTTEKILSFNTQEYNFDAKLTFPRLLIPFKSNSFIQQNNPKTIISTLFSYQNRPEYNKMQAALNFDYFLKSSDFSSHIVTPLRLSLIRVPVISDEFREWIYQAFLQESYEDHFIIGSKYSYTFSNQGTKGNNFYFQANFLPTGNLMYSLMKLFNADTVGNAYIIPYIDVPFAQFVKTDFDFRYYFKYSDEQQLIFRLFAGVAVPYGNSNLLPFGEKYFVGGANSIRAWQARSLGPGEYVENTNDDSKKFYNQTGDIKLEINFEYRFSFVEFLEGALFVDAGNIWAINSYDTRTGGIFFIDDFYKQIAVGTGFGVRLNLSFFVFRTDIGIKLIEPSVPEGQRFILMNRDYKIDDFTLNIAIGYPF